MKPHEIEAAIRERLDGRVHEYAIGMDRASWNELVIEVQCGQQTIEQQADTIRAWANGGSTL
ncbi:MAG: hypothetical protein KJ060_16680 [Candidatus Hydrogenedentes bacterium]|nr:hypothetical protein [Candidatus Hydrogenedentota bacterium]